jgi:capsular exopolysaccharide synthesis family protein
MSSPEANAPEEFDAALDSGEGVLQRIAWRRKELLFLGCVVGIVVGAIYYSQQPSVYQSTAEIVVEKEFPGGEPLVQNSFQPWDDYVGTQVEVLKSPAVMDIAARLLTGSTISTFTSDTVITGKIVEEKDGKVVVRLPDDTQGLESIPRADIRDIVRPPEPFASANEAELAARIKGGFSAVRQTKDGLYNRVLYLSFRGGDPDECKLMLNAVIEAYGLFLHGRHQKVNDKTVGQVTRVIESLKKSIDEKKKAYDDHLLRKPPGSPNDEQQLTGVRQQRSNEQLRRDTLARQVDELSTAIKEGKGPEVFQAMRGKLLAVPAPGGGDMKINDMIVDHTVKMHLMLADWGPDHPEVKSLRRKIKFLEDFSRGKIDDPERKVDSGSDPVQVYLSVLKHDLRESDLNLEHLDKQVRELETRVKAQADFKATEDHLRAERDQDKQRFESIIDRLESLKLSKNLGGLKVDTIAPATGGYKVGPVPLKIFMASTALGLLLGALLALVAELMDRSFHTIEEVRERLGLPVVGHIPIVDARTLAPSAGSPLEPILCTYFQPRSHQAESFRGIRTWMYFTRDRGANYKVIQITSPQALDGKTTLAANLAVSMAQSGKKVILLDADFRKPRVHQIFGVSSTVGLASVIAGTVPFKDAIVATVIEGLSVMPCGPRPENPAELLTSPAFQKLLDTLRQDFDYVLIDTPPLLAVSDPSAVAARVDGVLLVVRFSKYARPNARRAKELLSSLQANVLGIVVNGYGRQGSPFGYDGYHGYGYGGYGYEDGNHSDEESRGGSTTHAARKPAPPPAGPGLLSRILGWWQSPSS